MSLTFTENLRLLSQSISDWVIDYAKEGYLTILFFHPDGDYGFLSNFSNHGFTLDDLYWPTVEHYYQSMKFFDNGIVEKIRSTPSPKKAKNIAHECEHQVRTDWDLIKVEIMKKALIQKFTDHTILRQKLIETGDDILIEDSKKAFSGARGGMVQAKMCWAVF